MLPSRIRPLLLGLLALVVLGASAVPAIASPEATTRLLVKPRLPATAGAALDAANARVVGHIAGIGVQVVEVPASRATALANSPAFEYVETDGELHALETVPNDTYWSQQWGPRKTDSPLAWDVTTGDPAVVVAVLDTGADAAHPDLADALVAGTDLINGDSDPADDNGHGTGVSGIVAARTDNSRGIAAYCWTCKVMPVKVLDANGSGSLTTVAKGVVWAADQGVDVINMSLGSAATYHALDDAIAYARGKGIVVVAAAGNAGSTTLTYPAASPGVVGVAATDQNDAKYTWSNYGSWVDVAAPGCHPTTLPSSQYGNFCGTSSASPAVAGIAALARAANPLALGTDVESTLTSTAVPVGDFVAHGRVDAAGAVAAIVNLTTAPSEDTTPTEPIQEPAPTEPAPTEPAPTEEPATEEPVATVPGEPQNVSAAAADEAASVAWDAPASDGGSPVSGYVITADPGGARITVAATATRADFNDLANGTSYTFSVAAENEVGTGPAATSGAVTPALDAATRLAGAGRIATAVVLSKHAFASAPAVVVARADAYADALAAAPLAAAEDAPILLTTSDRLASEVAAEVDRLGATKAILVGGTSALSPAVEDALQAAGVTTVVRFAGVNRFDTAAKIARRLGGTSVYLAEGANADSSRGWPDAVAVSGLAAFQQRPILLATRDTLPAESLAALSDLGVRSVTVVGGTAAISDAVASAAGSTGATVIRLAGASRYETSARIADAAVAAGARPDRTWMATGRGWADALAAGPAAAATGGVLLLVDGEDLKWSPPAADWVADHSSVLAELFLVGGSASISAAVESDLEALLP